MQNRQTKDRSQGGLGLGLTLVRTLVGPHGGTVYEVQIAPDGPAALAGAVDFRPHVILLDLGLPVMDGYEVADRLGSAGVFSVSIAVTGYGQEADRARSEAGGFAAHFVKPVDLEELKRCMDRLIADIDVIQEF